METLKKILKCLVTIICILSGIIIILPSLILIELLSSEYMGRLLYHLDTLGYRFWKYVSPDTLYLINEPDYNTTLKSMAQSRATCRTFRRQFIDLIRSFYEDFLREWQKHEDKKFCVALTVNAMHPFYEETFKFLNEYFDVHLVPPGIIPIDEYGIMHIKIIVRECKKSYLTIEELHKSLHIRLVNVLMKSEYLIDIPLGYWSTSTVYFPDLERNLENDCLVVMLALSKAGSDHITSLRREENNVSYGDLEETL